MGALVRGGTRQENMCGRRSFHLQISRRSACDSPDIRLWKNMWGTVEEFRRIINANGAGRLWYLHFMPRRRFKNNFRKGSQAALRKTAAAASLLTWKLYYHVQSGTQATPRKTAVAAST